MLRAVANGPAAVGVSDVSRATGLAKSTCSRILASLSELGIVERVDEAGRFVVGEGLRALAGSAVSPRSLREVARPHLVELANLLGECASIAVRDGRDGLYVDQVTVESPVQVTDWTGQRFPLHTIAAGLALMGAWGPAEVEAYAAKGLEAFTEYTVASKTMLKRRVAEVSEEGVAWTMGEFSSEINGLAAPVIGPDGQVVASVAVYGPAFRFPIQDDRSAIEQAVCQTALSISTQLVG